MNTAREWLGLGGSPSSQSLDPIDPNVLVEPVEHEHSDEFDEELQKRRAWLVALGLVVVVTVGWLLAISSGNPWLIIVALIATLLSTYVILLMIRGPLDDMADDIKPPEQASKRVRRALAAGEQVLWEAREHPISLIGWWVALILIHPLVIYIAIAGKPVVALITWLIAMVIIVVRMYVWDINRVALTNNRLLVIVGLFWTKQGMILLSKVTDGTAHFTPLSNILAHTRIIDRQYVMLRFESAGQDQGVEKVVAVGNGHAVNRLIMSAVLPAEKAA